jgi:hypothetical protein
VAGMKVGTELEGKGDARRKEIERSRREGSQPKIKHTFHVCLFKILSQGKE